MGGGGEGGWLVEGARLKVGGVTRSSWYKWGREWMEKGCVNVLAGGSRRAEAGGKLGWSYGYALADRKAFEHSIHRNRVCCTSHSTVHRHCLIYHTV